MRRGAGRRQWPGSCGWLFVGAGLLGPGGPQGAAFSRRSVCLSPLECHGYDFCETWTLQACPGLFFSAGLMRSSAQAALGVLADGGGCC